MPNRALTGWGEQLGRHVFSGRQPYNQSSVFGSLGVTDLLFIGYSGLQQRQGTLDVPMMGEGQAEVPETSSRSAPITNRIEDVKRLLKQHDCSCHLTKGS